MAGQTDGLNLICTLAVELVPSVSAPIIVSSIGGVSFPHVCVVPVTAVPLML
jgi:hypothetical protein